MINARINRFRPTYRQLDELETELVEEIKDQATRLDLTLDQIYQPGEQRGEARAERARYTALARTALEEAVMWATKAVTT